MNIAITNVNQDGVDGVLVTFSDGTRAGYVIEELLQLRPVREAIPTKERETSCTPWCSLQRNMTYSLSAMLHIPGDVRDAIAFYARAFGATTCWSTPQAADMVAQLLVHGAEFWVHPAGEEIGNPSPEQLGGTAVRLILTVDDPDVVFDQAVAAGAVVRSFMQNRDYGWRDGSVMDPSGHRWEIGKPL